MLDVLSQLSLFLAKAIIIVTLILILLAGIISLLSRGKQREKISIKNLNSMYENNKKIFLEEILSKKEFKQFLKDEKTAEKNKKKAEKKQKADRNQQTGESQQTTEKNKQTSANQQITEKNQQTSKSQPAESQQLIERNQHQQSAEKDKTADGTVRKKNIFVLNFDGDIKASAVTALREEITAILNVAGKQDEVLVRIESSGGMVHAYGLAAAQLARIRQQDIPLIVTVDKVAASGGYLMACIADKILAAPFAIIGSIGVIVQLPNFHRLLKEKNVDFEQITAGNFKRTLTLFGENTEAGREKCHHEIEEIHGLFKNLIHDNRPGVDIDKVATGEHWLAKQAIEFKLVDELRTSDDYLLEQSKTANLFEVNYHIKKSISEKLFSGVSLLKKEILDRPIYL
jgi:serine protease SohB